MKRVEGWDVALSRYCDFVRKVGLEYGISDCVMMAAGGVEVQTGVDLGAAHRGKYHDLESARAYMVSNGWGDVDDVCDSFLGLRKPPLARKRGDILCFRSERGKSLGICLGQYAMVMSPDGAVQYPSSQAISAWSVGDA